MSSLFLLWDDAKLLQEAQLVVVVVNTRDSAVPELVDNAVPQFDSATCRRYLARWTRQRAGVGPSRKNLQEPLVVRGEQAGSLYLALGEGRDETLDVLSKVIRSTERHPAWDVNRFAVICGIGCKLVCILVVVSTKEGLNERSVVSC